MNKCMRLVVAILLLFAIIGCTSHRKPLNEGRLADGGRFQGGRGSGEELYTEGDGLGKEGVYCGDKSKCRPGKMAPRCEQHYFFNYDCNDVSQEAMESIQLQANYLLKHPTVKVRLEGNADDRGSREYNIALGERRARAVLDVLRQFGVSNSQVTVISFGAEKPAVSGDDEKSYQCNRRVDLKYNE